MGQSWSSWSRSPVKVRWQWVVSHNSLHHWMEASLSGMLAIVARANIAGHKVDDDFLHFVKDGIKCIYSNSHQQYDTLAVEWFPPAISWAHYLGKQWILSSVNWLLQTITISMCIQKHIQLVRYVGNWAQSWQQAVPGTLWWCHKQNNFLLVWNWQALRAVTFCWRSPLSLD